MTQKSKVLAHLKAGRPISGKDAWITYRIYRLSDVIFKLRNDGHDIWTRKVMDAETGVEFGQYYLPEKVGA